MSVVVAVVSVSSYAHVQFDIILFFFVAEQYCWMEDEPVQPKNNEGEHEQQKTQRKITSKKGEGVK